jgi:LPS sulfotransferase NodH
MRFDDLYHKIIASDCDQPPSLSDPRKIIVCTTPRTAGHSICQILRHVGLGMPTEYFQWQYALPLMRRWSADDKMDLDKLQRQAPVYGQYLLQKRSVDRVFSTKIFHENFEFMRRSIGEDNPSWVYVFLTRRNKTEQTISLLSMLLTGRPFGDDGVMRNVRQIEKVTRRAVENVAMYISASEANWKTKLALIDVDRVSTVYYEDFVSDPSKTLAAGIGGWFPDVDFSVRQGPGKGRYRTDKQIKIAIEDEFGDYIRSFWQS